MYYINYKHTAYVCLLLAHNEVFALISYCNIRPQGKQTHEHTIICDVMTKESPVCQWCREFHAAHQYAERTLVLSEKILYQTK